LLLITASGALTPGVRASVALDGFAVDRYVQYTETRELRIGLTITADESVINKVQAIGLKETFPKAWNYAGLYEERYGEDAVPACATSGNGSVQVTPWQGSVDFYWIEVPRFPVTIVYGLATPGYNPGDTIAGTLYIVTETENIHIPCPVTPTGNMVCLAPERDNSSQTYVPGQNITVRLQLERYCEEAIASLRITEDWDIPATFQSVEITYPESEGESALVVTPEPGSGSPFVFEWAEPPVFPLIIAYALHIPASTSGLISVTGRAVYTQYGESVTARIPRQTLYGDIPDHLHPADADQNWRVVMDEAIQYMSGWQSGSNPMSYAIRAAYLWQVGEHYLYRPGPIPTCWESRPICR